MYQYRSDISLYDSQYDDDGNRVSIPEAVINSVIAVLLRFQINCAEFGVPRQNIRVLATEATRTAPNSEEFRQRIAQTTGLTIEMLSKREEGQIGAMGVASSFSNMRGLVMDLGGGSTQITWMVMDEGHIRTSEKGAFSFPYGAAALTRRLADLEKGKGKDEAKKAKELLRKEMTTHFQQAYHDLQVPEALVESAKREGGFPLYLSGGGFRGWGYLLLYQNQVHGDHYPISIINGFTAHKDDFQDTETLKKVAETAHKIFRVSDRRRKQVPAVAFLVNVLADAIPHGIKEAHFCQGGVREGVLFHRLPPSIRAQDPLEVATSPYARPLAPRLTILLRDALPPNLPPELSSMDAAATPPSEGQPDERQVPDSLTSHVVCAMANMFYFHANMSKESSSASALQSTSTGILASTHGISHIDRALLALLLEARYEGELPPREMKFKEALRQLLAPKEAWWAEYLGRVGLVLSRAYPAGHAEVDEDTTTPSDPIGISKPRMKLSASWADNLGKKGNKQGIRLTIWLEMKHRSRKDPTKIKEALERHIKRIEKAGKKKNWIGGREGWGMKVGVVVRVIDSD